MCRDIQMIDESESEYAPTDSDASQSDNDSVPPVMPCRRSDLRKRKYADVAVAPVVKKAFGTQTKAPVRRSTRVPQPAHFASLEVDPPPTKKAKPSDQAKRKREDLNTFRNFNASSREADALLREAEQWVRDYQDHWIPSLPATDENYVLLRDWITTLRRRLSTVQAGMRKETRITPLVQLVWDDYLRQLCSSLHRFYRKLFSDMLSG